MNKEAKAKDIEVGDFEHFLQHGPPPKQPAKEQSRTVDITPSSSIIRPTEPQTWADRLKSIYTVDPSNSSTSALRKVKWEYAIPIIATPIAHIFVSLIRTYPQHRRKLYYGVGIATFLTIQARLILMYDAGYPGAEKPNHEGLPTFLKILLF